ncbi:MAG: Ig domain-containing protein [Candidatus Sulfotelmatobacter sp.]
MAYTASLSATGGVAPYYWSLITGALPSGIQLHASSGVITGMTALTGSYPFTAKVTDASGHSATTAFTLTVSSSSASGTVLSISPVSTALASQAQQQFTASISGTADTAVTWSASAGTISSSGAFTAPKVTSTTSVTITATSVANASSHAAATVTVTPQAALAIVTSSLAGADAGMPYTTSLSATGGVAPYHWSLATGGLPSGIHLQNSSGVITGMTALAGSYPLTAKVTDAASNSATQRLTLAVSAAKAASSVGSSCGAPNYCSTTSTANPGTISPLFTGTIGVNQTAYDSTYNPAPLDCYTRATDSTTFVGDSVGDNTYSGGDNDVMWSRNSDFVGTTRRGYVYILNLNISGNCAQVLNTGQISGGSSYGIGVPGPFAFSRQTDNVFYNVTNHTQIYKNTITIPYNKTYTPTLVFDISTCPQFSGLTGWSWDGILGVSDTDTRFSVSLSNTGGQGTGRWQVVYDTTLGCATLNTSTGAYYAFGATSQTGTLATSTASCWGGPIHDSQFSGDGNYVVLTNSNDSPAWTQGGCASLGTTNVLMIWQAGTQHTQGCSYGVTGSVGLQCGGHVSVGTSKIVAVQGDGAIDSIRALSNTLTYTQFQTGSPWASHGWWSQWDKADDYPWVYTPYGLTSTGQDTGCGQPGYCPINGGNAISAIYPGNPGAYPPGQARTYFGHTYSCSDANDSPSGICTVPSGANWAATTGYTITPTTSIITPTSGNAGNYSFEASVGGTSGGSAPTWTQTVGATVTDGGVTWINLGVAGAAQYDSDFGCQESIMSVSQDGNWAALASGMLLSLGLDSSGNPRCDIFIVHLR